MIAVGRFYESPSGVFRGSFARTPSEFVAVERRSLNKCSCSYYCFWLQQMRMQYEPNEPCSYEQGPRSNRRTLVVNTGEGVPGERCNPIGAVIIT